MAGNGEWHVWCLVDGRPGHVNQSQGILDALGGRFPVRATMVPVDVRSRWRKRVLRWMAVWSPLRSGPTLLRFAYAIDLPPETPDLIIASGGDTQAALATLGAFFRVPTVYSGHPKGLPDTAFTRVVTVTPRTSGANNVVLPLPPSPRPAPYERGTISATPLVACLIGGATAGIRYSDDDWRLLAARLEEYTTRTGSRLLLTTSRRTGARAESLLQAALPVDLIECVVWWSQEPRPAIKGFLSRAQSVLVTEDSLSMVAESIYSGLPVVSLLPSGAAHSRQDEQAMQGYASRGFLRRVVIGQAIPSPSVVPREAPSWEQVAGSLCESIAPLCRTQAGDWRGRTVLIWGRTGAYGPDYPRNRVVEAAFREMGMHVLHHRPRLSVSADIEYRFSGQPVPDVIWVPCFRHRDVKAAARAASVMNVPLIFDPLVSAWEKKVHERQRYPSDSFASRRLLASERQQMALVDVVVADTRGHASYFQQVLQVDPDAVSVVPVGAEQPLFASQPFPEIGEEGIEFVWFGSFIGLHGLDVIAGAVKRWAAQPDAPVVHWRFLGEGPERAALEAELSVVSRVGCRVTFEPWGPLEALPSRLASAHVILGIFDAGRKSRRVIPNKVYQGLALARVVLTSRTEAYSADITAAAAPPEGIAFCEPGNAEDLFRLALSLASRPGDLPRRGEAARGLFEERFSPAAIRDSVTAALDLASERHRNRKARECHAERTI